MECQCCGGVVGLTLQAEWEKGDTSKHTKAIKVVYLKWGDTVLAVVKEIDVHEKSWRIVELCGKSVRDDDSIGEIYFDTFTEAREAVESYLTRKRIGKELEPKIFTEEKEESIEDALKTITDEWIKNRRYCDETLYTLRNWVIWKLNDVCTEEDAARRMKDVIF